MSRGLSAAQFKLLFRAAAHAECLTSSPPPQTLNPKRNRVIQQAGECDSGLGRFVRPAAETRCSDRTQDFIQVAVGRIDLFHS